MSDLRDANHEQIEYWNGAAGERWVRHQAALDRCLRPFGEAALDRLALVHGERVLDVGCGAGDTALAISRRLAGSGEVVGIDPSRPLLVRARERAASHLDVSFLEADAMSHDFTTRFDALFSRFGVMFFADPLLAFRNLHHALCRGGRLAFVCWQALEQNPWCSVPLAAALQVLAEAPAMPAPGAAGPFAFADPRHVKRTLSSAGFTRIEVAAWVAPVVLSEEGLDAAIDFTLRVGPVSRLIAEQAEPVRELIRQRIRSALAPAATVTTVTLDGAAWLVTARA